MTFDSKVKLGLGIFATALFALCIGGMVYSFFKPVTDPNAPEPPQPFSAPACSAECKLHIEASSNGKIYRSERY